MKILAALSLAALIVAGAATGASAFPHPTLIQPDQTVTMIEGEATPAWDHCHGQTSGTAHEMCGTATGGPSGGLF